MKRVAGRLDYPADAAGNRIPDFSYAGYRGGNQPLPNVSGIFTLTVSPEDGDDTARIQAAISAIEARELQGAFRGVVQLAPGVFQVGRTLRISKDGVVFRGSGDGNNPGMDTIIRYTGRRRPNGNGGWIEDPNVDHVILAGLPTNRQIDEVFFDEPIPGSQRPITDPRVQVGARSFRVSNVSGFKEGDPIVIVHPSAQAWIEAVDHGGVKDYSGNDNVTEQWIARGFDVRYHRYISKIVGNEVTVDAPVFMHLDRNVSESHIFKDAARFTRRIGIERVRIDIVTEGETTLGHGANAIAFSKVEDSWVRDCTVMHFSEAGVIFDRSTRSTAKDVRAIDPHATENVGGTRYNFCAESSQLILFQDCLATKSRHGFIANGAALSSGNVVHRGMIREPRAHAEGHRQWSTGLLFDNIELEGRAGVIPGWGDVGFDFLSFTNRGEYGSGHGWSAAHSVMWNCRSAGGSGLSLLGRPPTAQNYAIGCAMTISAAPAGTNGWATLGFVEPRRAEALEPASLYSAQLMQRVGRSE